MGQEAKEPESERIGISSGNGMVLGRGRWHRLCPAVGAVRHDHWRCHRPCGRRRDVSRPVERADLKPVHRFFRTPLCRPGRRR